MVMRMHAVKVAFDKYDHDDSGYLDKSEFRKALQELEVELTEDDFETLYKDVDDDGNGRIVEAEFRRFVGMLIFAGVKVPVERQDRVDNRLRMTIATAVAWLLLGMGVFAHLEGWGYEDGFYFSVITLTTIGLGDL